MDAMFKVSAIILLIFLLVRVWKTLLNYIFTDIQFLYSSIAAIPVLSCACVLILNLLLFQIQPTSAANQPGRMTNSSKVLY